MQINTKEELIEAVAQLQYYSNQMCNASDMEDVAKNFVTAEDILTSMYKHVVENRIQSVAKSE